MLRAAPSPSCCLPSLGGGCASASEGNGHLPLQVFQRRNTGQLDFFKRWRTYVEGFGDPRKEFWLGVTLENPGWRGWRGDSPLRKLARQLEDAHRVQGEVPGPGTLRGTCWPACGKFPAVLW